MHPRRKSTNTLADAPYTSPSPNFGHNLASLRLPLSSLLRQFVRLETRLVTALYLQRSSILVLVTISIVVALDISNNISYIVIFDGISALDDTINIFYYAILRSIFVAPLVLLFAGAWGCVWAEYTLATGRERSMLSQCSKSHLPALLPALILGICIGSLHFAITGFVKPKAIELESVHFDRDYGLKFDRPVQSDLEWIAGNGFMLKAQISLSERVQLDDVHVFNFGDDQSLTSIIRAERTRPTEWHNIWAFENGVLSDFPSVNGDLSNQESVVREARFEQLEFELPISRLWLENFGVLPIFLPQPVLHAMIEQGHDVPEFYKYQMAAYERYAAILYCVVIALVSAHLAITRFRSDMMPYHALGVAAVGFIGYFFLNVTNMLGHHAYIPVFWAIWSIPISATVGSVVLVGKHVTTDWR
jgi:lipopolysaccharide export system permease protein